jgi:hypothetical protein
MPIIGSLGGGSAGGFGQRKGGVAPIAADYLIVAGGASGSTGDHSGGGGAGGYRTSFPGGTEIEIKGGDNTVTVGAGGAAIVNPPNPLPQYKNGNQGSDSDIQGVTTITSAGGGCGLEGSGANTAPYGEGGSGGGGYYVASSGPRQGFGFGLGNIPNVSPPQGNPGGQGTTGGTNGGGGGGGAGTPGNAGPSPDQGGPGGNGTASNITGSPVTYAGGGGGGVYGMGNPGGSGGPGGGGAGAPMGSSGSSGSNGLGGGGGGGSYGVPATPPSGAGGHGRVIIRFPSSAVLSAAPGTNTITEHPGGDKLATFNVTGTLTYDGGA